MPSKFRIPKATIDGAYGAVMRRVAKRMWGQVPDNAYVLWHNKPVMNASSASSARSRSGSPSTPTSRPTP